MEVGETCQWYLLRAGTDFAIQYYGDEPEKEFPPGLDGTCVFQGAVAKVFKMSSSWVS